MPVASGDQCGIAAVSRDGVHFAGFVCVYKVILAQKGNESNRRAARGDLAGFGGIAIGEKPQIRGVTVFDGYERRTVPRNVQPLQAVVRQVIRQTVRFARGIGNGIELPATGWSALANANDQCAAIWQPCRKPQIVMSGVERARGAVFR